MDIKLFEPEDMKSGRKGGGKKGGGDKYVKYKKGIAPHLDFLRQGIYESKDGQIRVSVEDIAKALGMTGRHETSIYWGLKYVLFGEGMVVTTGQTKGGAPVLIIREKKDGEVLPESLAKHLTEAGGAGSGEAEKAGEAGETV